MKKNDKKMLLEYLKSHKLMTIATSSSAKKPWVATVYYATDDKLNFYCLTSPQTDHAKHIAKNPNVACNITDSHQLVTDKKVGMQIQGKAKRVNAVSGIKWALKMWHKVNPGKEAKLNFRNMKNKVISARVYKITPNKIRFFNEKLYAEKEHETFYLK